MGNSVDSLTPTDVTLHSKLGIPSELLEQARIRRVSDLQAREVLSLNGKSGNYAGIEYPYIDPRTGRRVDSRVRLDHPPLKADGSPDQKYRSAYGDNRHLFYPPDVAALLVDTSCPAVLVEAEKSSLAIVAAARRADRQILPIATGGCWAWRGVIGKETDAFGGRCDVKGPLPDFNLVHWNGRRTVILFDARANESVRAARRELARELRGREAEVRHAYLPDDDVRVNGPDDLIAAQGDQALWRVIDAATTEDFQRTKSGSILADDLDNVRLALQRLGVSLRYDAFARRVLIDDDSPADDVALDRLWVAIEDTFHFHPSKTLLFTILRTEAMLRTMHPVRDYLDKLDWDHGSRLNRWLIDYGGATKSEYVSAVGALTLIAAVRRVRRPGCKFDELLILESNQGTLKSTALRTLCPLDAWFSDDLPLGVDSKQVIERTAGKWLIEAAEMHGNRGREAEQLKSFLSRQVDGPARLAYDRLPTEVPRQFVLIGTTNATSAYLKDATGARRFWPVRVQAFDIEALRRDRDQLWAEAATREAQGESIRLAPELWDVAEYHQEQRRARDPWEDTLEPLIEQDVARIDGEDVIGVDAIWRTLGVEARHQDNRHADRVAQILQRHGFTGKKRVRLDGKPVRVWFRVPSVPSTDPTD